jgi:hypothetical protein
MNNLVIPRYYYKVIKKISASPLPIANMDQYFLCDDQNNLISFWNDININLN